MDSAQVLTEQNKMTKLQTVFAVLGIIFYLLAIYWLLVQVHHHKKVHGGTL